MTTNIQRGTCYGVGVGPGDPELLTLKAARILREVDWIFHPAASSGRTNSGTASSAVQGFARRIIAPLELPEAKFRQVTISMSRERSAAAREYQQAASEILVELDRGRSVAWITEGDPLFFSTFLYIAEELQSLCPEVDVQIVPGVTSVQAAAAAVALPIARLSDNVAIVPAAYGIEHLPTLVRDFSTIALMKVSSMFDRLLDLLPGLAADDDESVQAVYIEYAGTPQQRIVTDLESLRGTSLPYFSLVLIRRGRDSLAMTVEELAARGAS
jgi:precorrin-2/cobalt-factor-2 C20-methyltransferase